MSPKRLVLLLFTIFVISATTARRTSGGRHTYPSGGGFSGAGRKPSGGGSHGYPSSGGLSGGSHGYPSSGGLSGGSHGYPSSGGNSGGSHGYPSSGGLSGGSHGYPSSGGLSGNQHNGYPSSNGGLSGTGKVGSGTSVTHNTHTTHVENHYHYTPPQRISYTPTHGSAPVNYPVYHGTPPNYVYQYKDSGSKYGTLLAGLALMNLGTLGVAAYAAHSAHNAGNQNNNYKMQPGEICKFGVKKPNGDYEETRIECQLISSFIYQYQEEIKQNNPSNITTVTTSVTNVTTVNTSNTPDQQSAIVAPNVVHNILPNGTLVAPGMFVNTTNITNVTGSNNVSSTSSVVTTITTNTTVINALDVKGKPVEVTPGMECYVLRNTPSSRMKKSVPCGLLQTYADTSIKPKNSAMQLAPGFTILVAILAVCLSNEL